MRALISGICALTIAAASSAQVYLVKFGTNGGQTKVGFGPGREKLVMVSVAFYSKGGRVLRSKTTISDLGPNTGVQGVILDPAWSVYLEQMRPNDRIDVAYGFFAVPNATTQAPFRKKVDGEFQRVATAGADADAVTVDLKSAMEKGGADSVQGFEKFLTGIGGFVGAGSMWAQCGDDGVTSGIAGFQAVLESAFEKSSAKDWTQPLLIGDESKGQVRMKLRLEVRRDKAASE